MRRLIVAGLLYLTGIAVLLVIKPQFMFQEDGRWKEFGIGRDQSRFTYMPLWLFAIVWSIISYMIVFLIEDHTSPSYDQQIPRTRSIRNNKRNTPQELVPGYYMLNESSTARNGVPRYVYLGPEEPTT
jgi:hypothetical protein